MTTLRIVVVPETVRSKSGHESIMFTAIGLEHYLVGQGADPQAAIRALDRAVLATLAANAEMGRAGLAGIGPAPMDIQAIYGAPDAQELRSEHANKNVGFALRPVLVTCHAA